MTAEAGTSSRARYNRLDRNQRTDSAAVLYRVYAVPADNGIPFAFPAAPQKGPLYCQSNLPIPATMSRKRHQVPLERARPSLDLQAVERMNLQEGEGAPPVCIHTALRAVGAGYSGWNRPKVTMSVSLAMVTYWLPSTAQVMGEA